MSTPPLFAAYAFDLDGTVYLGDELLPGAAETILELRRAGARVVFVTNKPLSAATAYADKLTALGIPTSREDIVTAIDALILYLSTYGRESPRLLTIAEPLLDEELASAGFTITCEPALTDVVVVSFDRTFSYDKLLAAFRAVHDHGASIVATNPDAYCPTPDGGLPDCAAMLGALEACTSARAEAIVGKPSRYMANALLERLDVAPEDLAVVGDRLTTDVAMGQSMGAAGILVLTGATTAAAAAEGPVVADFVIKTLDQLTPTFRGAAR
ncbi:MAG TPA: HAD-IIA family hydrolase [Gaiellaceae bacterium]|jgi:NagD protein